MSSVELLDLPDHILTKILNYVPDHFVVASVCQKFYELDCLNHRNILEMTLCLPEDDDDLDIPSVLSSKRVFQRMDIEFGFVDMSEWKILKKIFEQHGSTVKELKLHATFMGEKKLKLSEREFIGMLKLFPNLEKLDISTEWMEIYEKHEESSDKAPFLPKLRELAFDRILVKFFTKNLPENVKSVTEKFSNGEDLTEIILNALQKRSLEKIQLANFFITSTKWPVLKSFLISQPNLKSLDIALNDDDEREPEFFKGVVKMKNLEHLAIGEINQAFIEKFPKMNLKSLEVHSFCSFDDKTKDFCLLKSASLEKLILPVRCSRPVDLKSLGENFPLKFLRLDLAYRTVNEILKQFPLLESLEMEEDHEPSDEYPTIYIADGRVFKNLKHLIFVAGVAHNVYESELLEMLKALPNLEKLHAAGITISTYEDFFGDLKINSPKIQDLLLILKVKKTFWSKRVGSLSKYFHYLCSLKGESSMKEESYLNDKEIKALQDFSEDEKMTSFGCMILGYDDFKYSNEIKKLQGYFKIQVNEAILLLRKGKTVAFIIPDYGSD